MKSGRNREHVQGFESVATVRDHDHVSDCKRPATEPTLRGA